MAKDMASPDEAKAVQLDAIEAEILLLQKELVEDKRIGFCHNDLQYGNIMMDEETKMITIIVSFFSGHILICASNIVVCQDSFLLVH